MPNAPAIVGLGIAPVLILPNIFPPELCRALIADFEATGGEPSGSMYDEDGLTVERFDPKYKVRRDTTVTDERLYRHMDRRYFDVLRPAIKRAFHIDVTRCERRLLARYDAEDNGHFSAHRDNSTRGTAHRQFACTINLNAEQYEGGNLRFPEFGPAEYRCPTGGAVIFSCALLHEALPVTRGRRYAALPFFYDESAAQIRDENMQYIVPRAQVA